MAIANVTLNNTFDEWRTVTNQVITFVNEIEGGNLTKFYSNSAVLTVTENVARGGKNYITLNTSSNVLDTSTLNVATANAVNIVFAALANTDARLILVSNGANTINAVANAAIIHSNLAFEQANTARVHANAAFLAANNFASDVGSAANAYARTVGTAGNSYTQTVGTAGNTYAETVGTAGNNYTRTVGTAGNTYTQTVGTAGNTYAETVGTAGNNYTNSVGIAGNTYAETVGTAGNNYTRTVGTAGNTYAETVGTAGNNYTRTVGTAGNNYTITVGNAGNTFTSQSFEQANTARIHSNNAYSQANLAFELASLASGNNANTLVSNKAAFDHANSAFEQANTARVHANAAFAAANSAVTDFSPAFIQANTARNHANSAFATANVAFANANTVMISAQAAFTVANASFLHANAGFAATNSAFDQANTARVHANTAHASANAGLATANASYAFGNSAHSVANLAFTHANNAYLAANTANNMAVGNTIANGMYQTRSTRSQLNFIETNQIIYNIVDDSAGNRINVSANIVGITPVAITSNAAFLHANAAFATTNANYAFSNSAHSIANLAFTHANNAYNAANTLSSGFSNTSGSSFAGNMQIPTGNLTIGDGTTQGIRLHVNSWIGIANVFPQVEVTGGSQFVQFNANTNFGGWNDLMLARDISIIYSRGAADDSANLIIGPWTDSSFGYKQDGAGRHGFNTSNPRHTLDANGTANISSTLTVGANIIVRGTSITINGLEVVQNTANQTITNKRVTSRVASTASNSATPTLNTDNTDHFIITGQTVNITSMTTNLSGTPTDGQKLIISMTAGSGTPTVAWGATFESSGSVTLPTSISTTRLDIGFLWNAATSKWRCVAAI